MPRTNVPVDRTLEPSLGNREEIFKTLLSKRTPALKTGAIIKLNHSPVNIYDEPVAAAACKIYAETRAAAIVVL